MTPSPVPPSVVPGTSSQHVDRTRQRAIVVGSMTGVGLASTCMTLIGSWRVSLWTDESATISASQRSLVDLWRMLRTIDAVHGLYYVFMHFWTALFGGSPFALRLPSALAVGATAVCIFSLGRLLADTRTGAVSAAVFTLLPRSSWSGIEARPYAMTALVATGATLALVHALRRSSGRMHWVAYAGILGVGIALNVYLALLAVGHLVTLLLTRPVSNGQRLRWMAAVAGGLVIGSPVVLKARTQTAQLGGTDLRWSNLLRNIVVNQWFLGDTPTTTTGRFLTHFVKTDVSSWWPVASVVLALTAWCVVARVVIRGWQRRRVANPDWSVISWAGPWLLVPTLLIGSYSVLVHPMYSPRYLTFAAPALGLAIGRGLTAPNWRWLQLVSALMLVVATLPVLVSERQPYGKNGSDWISVADFMMTYKHEGDAVYYSPRYPSAPPPIGQTTRGIAVAYPDAFSGLTDLTLVVSPSAAANLTGLSSPLSKVSMRPDRFQTVWVIRRLDYPLLTATADDHLLTSAGLTASVVWRGPLDEVVRFNHE